MRLLLILLYLGICLVCEAQLQTLDAASSTVGSGGYVRFNNYAELGQKNADKLDYSEIRGSCFWDSEWNPAILILKSGKGIKLHQVKLNFKTNDVHYIDNKGTELVAQSGIQKILFFDRNDTTKLKAVFQSLAGFKIKDVDVFAELLAEGKTEFLKRTEVTLIKKDNDPMLGRPDLRFVSEVHYYITENGSVSRLKSINKANLFVILKPTNDDETWLKTNKVKLKNEADVIAFLAHRNSNNK